MKLVNFSVSNFRSITTAHKISISDTTILIGKNNEGKSNLLKALDIAMTSLQRHAMNEIRRERKSTLPMPSRRNERFYLWERDFPIQLQSTRTSAGTQTVIRLEFLLDSNEIDEFKREIKSNLNGSLTIEIKISKKNETTISVLKRGKGSQPLNSNSGKIADFIGKKLNFNYIPAVRTDQEALDVVRRMLEQRLRSIEEDEEYIQALQTIKNLQQPILDTLSERIKEPLKQFLPSLKNVTIEMPEYTRRESLRRDFDIIIDDGTPTNLSFKGDGVKSLAALGLLKDRVDVNGASIIAIEEPESHLHPEAIHQLNEIIRDLGRDNQVILTTHNPLFVDRHNIKSNIIVNAGKALPAKNIKQVRELLGIRASDNLTNASYVLVVEGEDDVISLKALLSYLSENLKKRIHDHTLVIESLNGAGNLKSRLSNLKSTLCVSIITEKLTTNVIQKLTT